MDTWHTRHEEYLKTDHWAELRLRCIKKANRACEACGVKRDLQGHHIRYRDPLESCTEEDVMSLCKRCHKYWHAFLKESNLKLENFTRETTIKNLRLFDWKNRKEQRTPKKTKFLLADMPIECVPKEFLIEREHRRSPEGLTPAQKSDFAYFLRMAPKCGKVAEYNYAVRRLKKKYGIKIPKASRKKKMTSGYVEMIPEKPVVNPEIAALNQRIERLEKLIFAQANKILALEQRD